MNSPQITDDIETILWDLDGTLIDSFGIFREIIGEVFPKSGIPVPSEEVITYNFHGSLEDTIADCVGEVSPDKLKELVQNFLIVQEGFYDMIDEHLYPDALGLAKRAHQLGLRQIVVTNRDHVGRLKASPRHIVQESALKQYIDAVVSGDDSEHRKPKPEVLGVLEDTFDHSKTLVIGDQFVDAEFAQNLGARGVVVARSGNHVPHMEKLTRDWSEFGVTLNTLDDVLTA